MTEPKPETAPPAAPPAEPAAEEPGGITAERIGTILMAVGVAAVAVILLDFALKGKLLGPLFARLPAPQDATVPDTAQDGQGDG